MVDFAPKVLPMYPDKLVRKAERRLEKLGNQLVMNSAVSEIQADKVILNKGGKQLLIHVLLFGLQVLKDQILWIRPKLKKQVVDVL